jgi:hypothetical protein
MTDREPWKILFRYWRARHLDGRPPARADIDPPTEIPRLAANLMLVEKPENGDYRYRLAGTAIEERARTSLTGRPIGVSAITPTVQAQWRAAFDAVRATPEPKLFVSRISGASIAKFITLMLPLVDGEGRVEMILVGCFFDGQVQPGTKVEGIIPIDIEL